MKTNKVTVESTATLVVAADDETRHLYFHNASGGSVYLGGSDVTTTTGWHLQNNAYAEFVLPANETMHGIVATGTRDILIMGSFD